MRELKQNNTSRTSADQYDVAILGSGMAGGMLGAVLARNGVKVLLLDAGTHPRFAVGESTIPYTSGMTRLIADRYNVPELKAMSSFKGVQEHVSRNCGRKQNFGFVYHEAGLPQDPEQINQLVVPALLRTETHLFRQDVDAYLFQVAVKHGAHPRLNTRIAEIDIDPDSGAVLRTERGEEFRASYVVDGSGFRSPWRRSSSSARRRPARVRTRAACSRTWSGSPPSTRRPPPRITGSPTRGTTEPCTTCSRAAGSGSSRSTTTPAR